MDNIDKMDALFKKTFDGFTEEVSKEEFETMKEIISRRSFFYFSLYTFNIFYSLAIFSGFLISVILGGHYVYTHVYKSPNEMVGEQFKIEQPSHLEKKNKENSYFKPKSNTKILPGENSVIQPSVISNDPKRDVTTFRNSDKNSGKAMIPGVEKEAIYKEVQQPESPLELSETNQHNKPDGKTASSPDPPLSSIQNPFTDSISKATLTPPKKKVIVILSDTIYQVDTVKMNGFKKRKK